MNLSLLGFKTFLTCLLAFGICLASDKIVGLKNFGETCYANAIFQLLYHNNDFKHSLQDYLNQKGTQANEHLMALQNIFDKMDQSGDGSFVLPDTFKALPKSFVRHKQYDVAEVLAYYQSIPELNWANFAIKIRDLFELSNLVTINVDLELFLNVHEGDQGTGRSLDLKDLLDDHFAKKRIKVSPSNLIVRIKRIQEAEGIKQKITDPIKVHESLSLKPYFVVSEGSSIDLKPFYQLESFIEHVGNSPNGGHYKFYFKHHATNEYYAINDERITTISQREFLQSAALAYMYLYRNIP